jgi:uncharacterized membrane protein required for colicin V production
MPWLVDAAVILCIASLATWGLSEGLVAQVLKLACLVLAILCTSWASPPLAALIDREIHSAWSYPLAYLMILLGVSVAAWVLTALIRGGVDATPLKLPDRLAVLAPGKLLPTPVALELLRHAVAGSLDTIPEHLSKGFVRHSSLLNNVVRLRHDYI